MPTVIHGKCEWDRDKALENERVHGISFTEACSLFDDPLFVALADRKHSQGESRYVIMGRSNRNRYVLAVFVERSRIRIISSRKMAPREIRAYETAQEEKF